MELNMGGTMGELIGWMGVILGVCVPLPQLYRIWKTKVVGGVSLGTYTFLVLALTCYLAHAIYINSPVFITAQSINLGTNFIIWGILIKDKYGR